MRRLCILAAVTVTLLACSKKAKKPSAATPPTPGGAAKVEARPTVELEEARKLHAAVTRVGVEKWRDPALEKRVAEALASDPGDPKAGEEYAALALAVADRLFDVWVAGDTRPNLLLADEDGPRRRRARGKRGSRPTASCAKTRSVTSRPLTASRTMSARLRVGDSPSLPAESDLRLPVARRSARCSGPLPAIHGAGRGEAQGSRPVPATTGWE
jgi:hypothetical protein